MGSLLLAEDRVLSYAAVLKSNNPGGAITAFIPEATFYFEAETDTEKLWTQRRRWINGTVAGYIWLMLNAGMIFHSQVSLLQKTLTTILVIIYSSLHCQMSRAGTCS
jgi:cellulose synthase/poly-beta-1,6-N-acetylglucosamine synthase-like glycosyltransferase